MQDGDINLKVEDEISVAPREFGCYEKLLVAPRPQRDNLQRNFIAYLVPTK